MRERERGEIERGREREGGREKGGERERETICMAIVGFYCLAGAKGRSNVNVATLTDVLWSTASLKLLAVTSHTHGEEGEGVHLEPLFLLSSREAEQDSRGESSSFTAGH